MTEFLFDTPWWAPLGLGLAGVMVFVSGNRNRKWHVRNVGAGVVVAAVLLAVVSWLVDTPTETALKKTTELTHAVARRDAQAVQAILDERTAVTDSRNRAVFTGKLVIATAATYAADTYGLDRLVITGQSAVREQTVITIDQTILTTSDRDRGMTGRFRFTWEQRAEGWHLIQISVMELNGQDPAQYLSRIRVPGM